MNSRRRTDPLEIFNFGKPVHAILVLDLQTVPLLRYGITNRSDDEWHNGYAT